MEKFDIIKGICLFGFLFLLMVGIGMYFQPQRNLNIELCESLGGEISLDNPYNVMYGPASGCYVYPNGEELFIDLTNKAQVDAYRDKVEEEIKDSV